MLLTCRILCVLYYVLYYIYTGNLLIVAGCLYMVGGDVDEQGNQLTRTIERYNDYIQQWEYIATFKDQRRGFSTCAVDHKIYVFGGSFSNGEVYNDTW